jgi:serine protease Do
MVLEMKATYRPYVFLAAGVLIGAVAFAALNKSALAQKTYEYQPLQRTASMPVAPQLESGDLKSLDQFYAELSDYAGEAVVHITVNGESRGRVSMTQGGEGSGFILSSDGWIVTNDHVVRTANEVTVVLADGRELSGKVTRANDESLDIALVKVDAKNLPVLKFANSDGVRPGQMVIAVGSPFGLENTVTFGHVSATGRLGMAGDGVQAPRVYTGMIQTDAAINPGNSGGPLININGEVIGVNTSIHSTSGSNSGIGFAIPANIVRVVANELINTGKFDRGLLGVIPRDLKPFEIKERNGLVGAYISEVPAGNGADKAGIKPGDVIVKIDDERVANEVDLRVALYKRSPEDTVSVTYVRDGGEKVAKLKLVAPVQVAQQPQRDERVSPFGEMPNFPEFPDFPQQQPQRPKLGVYLYDVDEATREQYKLPNGLDGAVIYRVAEGSVAEAAGLKPGDVITRLGDKKITTSENVMEAMNGFKLGQEVSVEYVRIEQEKAVERTKRVRLK